MADSRITNLDFAGVDAWVGHPGDIVYTSALVGYFFSAEANAQGDLRIWKTTNGGVSWSAVAGNPFATDISALNVWYDKWTPGISGNLIHVSWVDAEFPGEGTAYYRAFNPATDNFTGAAVAIRDLSANGEYADEDFGNRHSLCRSLNGRLWWAYDAAPSPGRKGVLCTSDNGGASWTKRSEGVNGGWPVPQVSPDNVDARLILAPSRSFNNIVMYFGTFDSANLKKYEWDFLVVDFGWSGGAVIHTYAAGASGGLRCCAVAMRNDFESFLVAANSTAGGGASVIKCYQIGAGGITNRADVVSGAAGSVGLPSIAVDAAQGHLYVGYAKGTNVGASGGACKTYWKRSINSGISWQAEKLYTSEADLDYRDVIMPRRNRSDGAGRVQIAGWVRDVPAGTDEDYLVNTAADPPPTGEYTVRSTDDGGPNQIVVDCITGGSGGAGPEGGGGGEEFISADYPDYFGDQQTVVLDFSAAAGTMAYGDPVSGGMSGAAGTFVMWIVEGQKALITNVQLGPTGNPFLPHETLSVPGAPSKSLKMAQQPTSGQPPAVPI